MDAVIETWIAAVEAQAQAIRQQMSTTALQLDGLEASIRAFAEVCKSAVREDETGPCQHPEDDRHNLSTIGIRDRWRCKRCGFYSEGYEA